MQSVKISTVETVLNVGSGFFVAMALNIFFLPFFAQDISNQVITSAIIIGVTYTGVSMVRSFLFRRAFAKLS